MEFTRINRAMEGTCFADRSLEILVTTVLNDMLQNERKTREIKMREKRFGEYARSFHDTLDGDWLEGDLIKRKCFKYHDNEGIQFRFQLA